MAGAVALFVGALAVFFIGSPSLEDKYNKVKFTRTETIPQLNADPIVNTYTYTADQMLEKRLVHITPAEAFKAKYNQIMNPIYLDVRPEAEYNLYHIEDAVNVPLDRIDEIVPLLLSEPPANSVFIVMGNDEATATQAWKLLVGSGVTNSYILEGGINNWIAVLWDGGTKRCNPTRMRVTTNWATSSLRLWAANTSPARPVPLNTKNSNSKPRSSCNSSAINLAAAADRT